MVGVGGRGFKGNGKLWAFLLLHAGADGEGFWEEPGL